MDTARALRGFLRVAFGPQQAPLWVKTGSPTVDLGDSQLETGDTRRKDVLHS